MPDRQVEGGGEVEVALIVGGDGHDRAGSVVGEHVVRDVDGQPLRVYRIDRVKPCEDARLLRRRSALRGLLRRRAANVVAHLLRLDPGDELVLRSEHEERRAVERVRAGREHGHVLVQALDPEEDLRTVRAADPVSLASLDRLRPVEGVEVVEQRLSVVRDAEEPLLHETGLDLRATPLAAAVVHLLVRENGLVVWAPLDWGSLSEREPALVELEELPLLPAVVLGLVCR